MGVLKNERERCVHGNLADGDQVSVKREAATLRRLLELEHAICCVT
jgi:hypothetical protein